MTTNDSIAMALEEFKKTTKPDSDRSLHRFRDAIIDLYFSDYTLATIFRFVEQNGYGGSRATFYRWVKKHIDFEKERDALRPTNDHAVSQHEAGEPAAAEQPAGRIDLAEEPGQPKSGEESAKNKPIPAATSSGDPSKLEGSSKRDPHAIMHSILGPSIEDQMKAL